MLKDPMAWLAASLLAGILILQVYLIQHPPTEASCMQIQCVCEKAKE